MTEARVLIVDDEPAIRRLMAKFVALAGFTAETAATGPEAMSRLDADRFDLVVTDIRMPEVDGMQLLSWTTTHHRETGVVVLSGCDDIKMAVRAMQLGALDYIVKPFEGRSVAQTLRQALDRHRGAIGRDRYLTQLESDLASRSTQLQDALNRLRETNQMALEALVAALDARERETYAHSERVSEYAGLLASELGIAGPELDVIRRGAMLHDVGKIGISDSILLKPGPLDEAEWVEMRKHPGIGWWIVNGVEALRPAADIVLCHHEQFNGAGYPRSLKGDEIPLGARIFSVADTLDVITSDRPYQKSRTFPEAAEEISRRAGSQFDPAVVRRFRDVPLARWQEIREETLRRTRPAETQTVLI